MDPAGDFHSQIPNLPTPGKNPAGAHDSSMAIKLMSAVKDDRGHFQPVCNSLVHEASVVLETILCHTVIHWRLRSDIWSVLESCSSLLILN